MSNLETEVICELLRALADHDEDGTPDEAFDEGGTGTASARGRSTKSCTSSSGAG